MALKKLGKYRFQNFEANFEADLGRRTLTRDGRAVIVSPRTFDLLAFFLAHPQREISKAQLMAALWPNTEVEETNLSQHIFLLRRALTGTGADAHSGDKLLLTLPGRGYRFTAEVVELPSAGPGSPQPAAIPFQEPYTPLAESYPEDGEPALRGPAAQFFAGFRHPGPWHVLILTALAVLLGFGALFYWRWTHRPRPQSLTLVLADFDSSTGDAEFDLALKTAATIDLQQSPFLQLASRPAIARAMAGAKSASAGRLTSQAARAVCNTLHSQAYASGAVRRFLRKSMVSLEAFDCATGRSLATSRGIADSPEGILAVLDKVALDLRRQLGEPASSLGRFRKPLFAGRAPSAEAFKAYSEASLFAHDAKPEGAQDQKLLLQRAVELDPQLALAFLDLGAVYANLGERDAARSSLSRAYELRETAGEPDRLYIVDQYNLKVTGDLRAAIRNAQQWSGEYPRNPTPLIELAGLKLDLGEPGSALEAAKSALALNPANAIAYELQARAQLQLGQLDQAIDTCRLAAYQDRDSEILHGFLLQIAFLRLDQDQIDAQIAWGAKSQSPYLLAQQGLMEFAQGKAKSGQATLLRAAESYRKQGSEAAANGILGAMPRILAELGLADQARGQLARFAESGPESGPQSSSSAAAPLGIGFASPSDLPVAWAHLGESSRAQAILKRELESHLTATLWQQDFAPQVQAAIALNQQRPKDAIEALKPAQPFDLRSYEVPALRGKAYLALKQPESAGLAEAEFHKIVDHPGLEPLSHNYPLARLGLARALAQQGKTADAQNAYNLFLTIWKEADPGLPRLRDAKAEYARLTGTAVRTAPVVNKSSTKPTASKPRKK